MHDAALASFHPIVLEALPRRRELSQTSLGPEEVMLKVMLRVMVMVKVKVRARVRDMVLYTLVFYTFAIIFKISCDSIELRCQR